MGGFDPGTIVHTRQRGKLIRARIEFRVERGEPLGQYSLYRLDGGGRFVECACNFTVLEEPAKGSRV